MNRDTLYAELDREDLGIDEEYRPRGAICGMLFAAAVSMPSWIAVISIAIHFWRKG